MRARSKRLKRARIALCEAPTMATVWPWLRGMTETRSLGLRTTSRSSLWRLSSPATGTGTDVGCDPVQRIKRGVISWISLGDPGRWT